MITADKDLLKKGGKRMVIIIACLSAGLIAAAVLVLYFRTAGSMESGQQDFPPDGMRGAGTGAAGSMAGTDGTAENGMAGRGAMAGRGTGASARSMIGAGMTVASGVTSTGVTEESFDVENLSTALVIEEVYIASESAIEAGGKVLKLSEESVAAARKELEATLREAELAYRSGCIEYEQSRITAEYDRDSMLLGGEQAKAVYQETVSGLANAVEQAREELEQAREDIAEYQSYVSNDTYKSYFKVDEYQAVYDETLDALKAKIDEWGVSWPQVTGQGGAGTAGNVASGATRPSGAAAGGDAAQNTGPTSDQVQVLANLYKVLEKQLQALEQAQSDYEDALANASFDLQTLELQLPALEKALAEAEKNYQNQLLQAELTYETSLAKAQSAEGDYHAAVEQAETHLASLQKAWEDAGDNLALFESSVGDSYFYASGSGTVVRSMVSAGRNLTSEAVIFLYGNPKETIVTVSVDQAAVSKVALHDSVYIQSGEYGGTEGVVTEINPISDSSGRTNVSYSVKVKLAGDTAEIPANQSVTVIFGMNTEMMQNGMAMGTNQ